MRCSAASELIGDLVAVFPMPQPGLIVEQRRALQLLAEAANGHTEAAYDRCEGREGGPRPCGLTRAGLSCSEWRCAATVTNPS
jgi:hypothetical protein